MEFISGHVFNAWDLRCILLFSSMCEPFFSLLHSECIHIIHLWLPPSRGRCPLFRAGFPCDLATLGAQLLKIWRKSKSMLTPHPEDRAFWWSQTQPLSRDAKSHLVSWWLMSHGYQFDCFVMFYKAVPLCLWYLLGLLETVARALCGGRGKKHQGRSDEWQANSLSAMW
jgi:hypothetical protein